VPRLFFALWPDDRARAALAPVARRLAGEGGGRPVPAANLHLTLAFLGDVAQDRIEAALGAASGIRGERFELVLDRTGAFRRAGVGWAGPSAVPAALVNLQAALDSALRAAGFTLEDRPFVPHLTLARKIVRPVAASAIEPVAWPVERFALVESARDRGAYRDIGTWEFGTGS
jgi:2'-5' RNA ligase